MSKPRKLNAVVEQTDGEIVIRIILPRPVKAALKVEQVGSLNISMPAQLSPRQQHVFMRILGGTPWKTIAAEMGTTLSTAKGHGWALAKRLGFVSLVALRAVHKGQRVGY